MSEQKPTVVLVHGAFADSSSWNGVIEKLQSHGHPRGVREQPAARPEQDSDYVRQLVESLPGPVVLVGHSYGRFGDPATPRADSDRPAAARLRRRLPARRRGGAVDLSGKVPGQHPRETLRPVLDHPRRRRPGATST
ncbi:alpha/beta fold hydrolase [Streptomyces sp. KL116D]|uniref:alpha/beta fold hydrolase n=1 Tax=Streptomyces sp. KL116D TaxID=3045152 RepID=UPI003556A7F8